MSNSLVSASILACDFSQLGEESNRALQAGVEWLHLDIMDGSFVDNISYGADICAAVRRSVPADAILDAHLMIDEPLHYLPRYLKAGCNYICAHIERKDAVDLHATLAAIRQGGAKAGLAINPATPVEEVQPYLAELDLVLVMSVVPGFGGQKFMEEVLGKVEYLDQKRKAEGYNYIIQMDGGIDDAQAPRCHAAGADCLVAGSYIFKAADMTKAVSKLRP